MIKNKIINRDYKIISVDCFLILFSFLISSYLLGILEQDNGLFEKLHFWTVLFWMGSWAIVWVISGVWRGSWRYTSLYDVLNISKVTLIIEVFFGFLISISHSFIFFSFFLLHWIVLNVILCLPRIGYRLYIERMLEQEQSPHQKRALLVYGGHETELFLRYQSCHPQAPYIIEGILDPSGRYVGQKIQGVPVLGTFDTLPQVVQFWDKRMGGVLILPSQPIFDWPIRRIISLADAFGLWVGKLPQLTEVAPLVDQKFEVHALNIEDLLGRSPHSLDQDELRPFIQDYAILITGAGGSIGSELVRQVASLSPKRLICFEQSEYALYQIDSELGRLYPNVSRAAVLGDIRDKNLLHSIFQKEKPHVVFHAAALKHVPLVEENVEEAVLTNIVGTKNIADVCIEHGVKIMVQISTDKVVKPSSVMGATKRVAEMYTQALDTICSDHQTRFVTVRFGNVLGSHGSVMPLFQKQIAAGGPVTITHPEMTRYFMSIKEASSLVIQALLLGTQNDWVSGQIFVLDMGEPVRIVELAKEMMRLSGVRNVEIVYTGMRPGEKLHEELFLPSETILPSKHSSIRRAASCPPDITVIEPAIQNLMQAAEKRHPDQIRVFLKKIIPDFDDQL